MLAGIGLVKGEGPSITEVQEHVMFMYWNSTFLICICANNASIRYIIWYKR